MTIKPHTARRVAILSTWSVFLVSLFVGMTGIAKADDSAPQLSLRSVDSTNPTHTKVVFHWTGEAAKLADLEVTEEGAPLDVVKPISLDDAGFSNDIVFVVDTSQSASDAGLVNGAKQTVVAMANSIHDSDPNARFSLIGAGVRDELAVNLTSDPRKIADAVSSLEVGGDSAVWDGLGRAARILDTGSEDHSARTIVLITDGQVNVTDKKTEAMSAQEQAVARGAIGEAGVVVSTIGSGDVGPFQALATSSGGAFLPAGDIGHLSDLGNQLVPTVTGFYVTEFTSNVDEGVSDLGLTVDGVTTKNSFVVGSFAHSASALASVATVSESTGIAALQGMFGKTLAIVLAAVACVMAAFGIFLLVSRESVGLDAMLQVYDESYNATNGEEAGPKAQAAFVQRAVAVTENLAARQGLITKYEGKLERADMPLRPAEYLLISGFVTVILMLVVLFVTRQPLLALLVLIPGVFLPGPYLNFKGARRRKKFEALLPDMLQLLAGTLKAGYSMMQGLEAVAVEVSEPMGKELRRVMTEARLGRQLEESLDAVADRMGSKDFGWAVMAIRIQREVGGNLSELLMTVSTTMIQRERLRRDVNSLTAEGRVSAYMLGIMPLALMLAMYVINKKYMMPLFTDRTGNYILAGGLVMIVAGFLWMNKLVKIEV